MTATDNDIEMRVLIPNEELDAAIADFGATANGPITIEQMRLYVADVTSCLACAAAMENDQEFTQSLDGMLPPEDEHGREFCLQYLDYLVAELGKEGFADALDLSGISARIDQIRNWIRLGS